MDKQTAQAYQELTRHGIDVQQHNQIRPNSGSETFAHQVAKTAVMRLGLEKNYRVASEVEINDNEADIILWGNPDRLTWIVEVETDADRQTLLEKADKYVVGPIDDINMINVSKLPSDMDDIYEHVERELQI